MSIEVPSSQQVSYLVRFNVGAVYAIVPSGRARPCIIGAATDLARAIGFATRKYKTLFAGEAPDLRWAAWADRAACGRIVHTLAHNSRCGLTQTDLPSAVAAIEATALRYHVPLCDHQIVLQRAGASADRIADKITATETTTPSNTTTLSILQSDTSDTSASAATSSDPVTPTL